MARYSRFTKNGGNIDAAYGKVWAAFLPLLREYFPEDKLVHERLLRSTRGSSERLTVSDLLTDRLTDVTKLIEVTAIVNDLAPAPLPEADTTEEAERANSEEYLSNSDAKTSDRDAYVRFVDEDYVGWEEDNDQQGTDGPETQARDLQLNEAENWP